MHKRMAHASKTKNSAETICVCLATDYAVSVAVVRTYRGNGVIEKPVVLFSADELVPLHDRDLAHTESFVAAHAKKLLERCRSFHGNFDRWVAVIGSPWTITTPRAIRIEKNAPFKVTQKIVDEAIARDARLFEQETNRDVANAGDFGVIGNASVKISINGYRANDWENVTAKTLDIHTAISIAQAHFVEMMIGAFADAFHITDISIESMDHARTHLFPDTISASAVDIGAQRSILAIVDRGVAIASVMFSAGLFEIERDLMREFAVSRTLVPSVMQFATDEKLSQHDRDLYYQRIKNSYAFFSRMLDIALQDLKTGQSLIPEPLVVMGHPAWVSVFHPLIESHTHLKTFVSDEHSFREKLLFAQDAHARTPELCLAILQSVQS